ncbi:hypothetical protein KC725_01100 [Candidatus Peregrinibacteria bacterium]|nr:hypothetical protein [Candidatus Peregrinibacteria bacterium]
MAEKKKTTKKTTEKASEPKISKKRIGDSSPKKKSTSSRVKAQSKPRRTKKVLYIEIDDEVTTIYDRIKSQNITNLYLVVPKRAILFQSIVNLKILKRKAEDLEKNIFIVTNDQNGIHLASKIGLPVYDKLDGREHPSLVEGKPQDDKDITPLQASVNSLDDDTPTRRKEKKYSISEMIRKGTKKAGLSTIADNMRRVKDRPKKEKKQKSDKGKLVLVAPNRQALVSLVIVCLLILVTITYIALPGATIALTPKSNVIDTSVNVTLADIELNRAELDTRPVNMIPSYKLTKKIQKVLTYQATGKHFEGRNATGKLTIMNDSGNPWPLVAETRFQTDDGIIFRIKNAVTVPASGGSEPGKLEVDVVADEFDAYEQAVGERGNIPPSKFFLPGLSEDNQQRLRAESFADFSGGETLVIKEVSAEDLEAARVKMVADLQASAEAELKALVQERNENQNTNLELLTGSDVIEMSEPVVNIPGGLEGQRIDNFEVSGEVIVSGVAYNKDDLLGILKTELKLKKNPQKRLYRIDEESLTYRTVESDGAAGKIKITATLKGIEEYELSPDKENGERLIRKIKDHVLNMPINEAEVYIQNLPEIDKVYIESWPAWAPNMPGIPDNIKIDVRRGD